VYEGRIARRHIRQKWFSATFMSGVTLPELTRSGHSLPTSTNQAPSEEAELFRFAFLVRCHSALEIIVLGQLREYAFESPSSR
jgi:hypothetical protein